MSSVVIAGNTSGSVTLQAPNVAGSTTLNLPTVSGGTLVTSDSSGNVGIGTNTPIQKLDVAGTVVADLSSFGQYHAVGGASTTWYNAFIRNDGADVYFLSSNSQSTRNLAAASMWNSYRPLAWNLSNGVVSIDGTGAGLNVGGRSAYVCRAWVNFNGTGTPSIRGSGGVSSISDLGTGTYNINFSTALPDTNYCTVTGCSEGGGASNLKSSGARPASTSAVTVVTGDNNTDTIQDFDNVNVTVFR